MLRDTNILTLPGTMFKDTKILTPRCPVCSKVARSDSPEAMLRDAKILSQYLPENKFNAYFREY